MMDFAADMFIKDARKRHCSIVYIGRGKPGAKREDDAEKLAARLIQNGKVAVILMHYAQRSSVIFSGSSQNPLMFKQGDLNHLSLFQQVDVVVHHGEPHIWFVLLLTG